MSFVDIYHAVIAFVEEYKYVLIFIAYLIMFIILVCKKKIKVVDVVRSVLLESLPQFIKIAEESIIGEKVGSARKDFVINCAVNLIRNLTDLDAKDVIERYGDFINTAIENILDTPSKKGE